MKASQILFFLLVSFTAGGPIHAQGQRSAPGLKVIQQSFDQALAEAQTGDKLIFIDFYTTWCAPCKQLDKTVFENDSIRDLLNEDVVLLKYDAENDSVFHLAKKYHINSYPTGLILNKDGLAVNRSSGFAGSNESALRSSVMDFVAASRELDESKKYLTGYSATIDPGLYPDFYTKYVNRTDTRIDLTVIDEYLSDDEDIYAEQYFSVLTYFASEASDDIARRVISGRKTYTDLYGEMQVENLIYFLALGKFQRACKAKNDTTYQAAVRFVEQNLSEEWVADVLPSAEKQYLIAKGKWGEVFRIYEKMKQNGEMDNGYINHFSWQVYKECDDPEVIKNCIGWMKDVTEEEPSFDYLDTYTFLLYKAGDTAVAKAAAEMTITAGKAAERRVSHLEKLLEKL